MDTLNVSRLTLTPAQVDIWKRWAASLRSGKYQQCRLALHGIANDGSVSYCCLGVLAHQELGTDFPDNITDRPWNAWGLQDAIKMPGLISTGRFVMMNDINLKSFSEIADEIEKMLLTATIVDQEPSA